MIAVHYIGAFAAADQARDENRAAMAHLIEMYVAQVEELENVEYPRLTIVHQLWMAGGANCNAYLAFLQEWQYCNCCFAGACLKRLAAKAERLR